MQVPDSHEVIELSARRERCAPGVQPGASKDGADCLLHRSVGTLAAGEYSDLAAYIASGVTATVYSMEVTMAGVQALSGLLAVAASIWLLRGVLHGYTDHEHLDIFHLLVAVGSAAVGLFLLWRALSNRRG